MKKYNILLKSCILTALVGWPIIVLATELDQQREQSILLIRSGQVEMGLQQLKRLLSHYPHDQKLIADYVVTAYANRRFTASDQEYIQNIHPANYPEYGRVSLVKGLRDLKQYRVAEQWVQRFNVLQPQASWTVWHGLLQAESGEKVKAQHTLKNIDMDQLAVDELSQLAYVYRIIGMPVESLEAAERAMKTHPTADSQEQAVLALMATSDYAAAQQIIKDAPETMPAEQKARLGHMIYLNEFSQQIQQAIQYYRNNNARHDDAYVMLDRVLLDMQNYAPQLEYFPDLKARFQFDYMYALNARNLPKQVLIERSKIQKNDLDMPTYVRLVLAESYLKRQQPQQAETLYKSVLSEPKFLEYNLYAGLYYSLIEQEKFSEADRLIATMEQTLPKYRYSQAKGVDREPHSDWSEFLSLKGLNYAYRNQLQKAEQYFEQLVTQAPSNLSYQNNLALIQRWREKPELSKHSLAVWNGLMDQEMGIQLNQMQNAQALTDISTWRAEDARLQPMLSDDSGFKRSRKELNDRNHPSISHQSRFSKSESDNPALLGQLKGSREQESHTRLNSPWFANNFRVFADDQYRWAKYDAGKLKEQRIGLGAEWQKDRKSASIMLSQDSHGDRSGAQLNWTQWLNDHWNYGLGYDSQADLPLQAVRLNNEGQSYQAGLNWQANESRKAGVSYQFTDIDDGNTRQEVGAYFKQRLQAAPHHITDATLRGYFGQNKEVDVPYFNPKQSQSIELSLEHNWMIWRNYERSFNQYFEATIGTFGQTNYSDKPIYNLFYQHEWQLSRTWKLNYGIGWGSHPYDGEDEQRTYAVAGFEGRF